GALLDDLSPTLSISNSNSTPHPWDIIPGVLVDIKKSLNEQKVGQATSFFTLIFVLFKKVVCPTFFMPALALGLNRYGFELRN
ncbi:unnamed protein product, partial [marine sediment metagenome]